MSNHMLMLPTELRLRIYNHVIPTVPLSEPRSQYIGLLYTSKQTQLEVEPEILAAMRKALVALCNNSRKGFITNITLDEFHNLHELENLTIHVHLDHVPNDFSRSFFPAEVTSDALLAVLAHRFNIVTMKVDGTHRYTSFCDRQTWFRILSRDVMGLGKKPPLRIKGFRVDWKKGVRRLAPPSSVGWVKMVGKYPLWEYEEEKEGAQIAVASVKSK